MHIDEKNNENQDDAEDDEDDKKGDVERKKNLNLSNFRSNQAQTLTYQKMFSASLKC